MIEHRKILELAGEIDKRTAELAAGSINRERQEQLWREGLHLASQLRAIRQEAFEAVVLLLNPITPHLSHALRQALGHPEAFVESLPFPKADPAALEKDAVTLAVQVNGKLRGQIEVPVAAPKDEIERDAMADANVQKFLAGLTVRKVIVVPGKIVNIVAN